MISYDPIIQPLVKEGRHQFDVLRLDLIHEEISGNKWFKLRKNLNKARIENLETILTFGGAFSNHIAATAAACKAFNLKSIGIIRGEETDASNPTLKQAQENGMLLHFVTREFYAAKNEGSFKKYITSHFGNCYIIPEGGNNIEGVLGCTEILKPEWNYDLVFCACGTGTTFAGLVAGKQEYQNIIGISVLKGENRLPGDVNKLLGSAEKGRTLHIAGNEALQKEYLEEDCILNSYAFKGYAKYDPQLVDFKTKFEAENKFALDHVYTTKLMFAVYDLIKQNKIKPNSKMLVIHSGGLQGNKGFEARYHLMPSL